MNANTKNVTESGRTQESRPTRSPVQAAGLAVFAVVSSAAYAMAAFMLVGAAASILGGAFKPQQPDIGERTRNVLASLTRFSWGLTFCAVPVAMCFPRYRRLHRIRKAAIWGAYAFVLLWTFMATE